MNNPLLFVLPALAGTMALSAARTVPPELRHDMVGKSPLSATKMVAAQGAGSACQDGCDDNTNIACYPNWGPRPGGSTVIYNFEKWTWHPHPECRFAWGADACVAGPDVWCYRIYKYSASDTVCSNYTSYTQYTSSTCPVPTSPTGS